MGKPFYKKDFPIPFPKILKFVILSVAKNLQAIGLSKKNLALQDFQILHIRSG